MTGFTPLLLLAALCWLLRLAFIVFVPAQRLPSHVTAALGHVAPAVLAALVSVGTVGGLSSDNSPGTILATLACVGVIAAVAYLRPSLTISAGLGIAAVLLIDVLLAR